MIDHRYNEVGRTLVSVHRLVLFFPDVYRFPDPPVHSVASSVDHLGMVPVYDVVERDGSGSVTTDLNSNVKLDYIIVRSKA